MAHEIKQNVMSAATRLQRTLLTQEENMTQNDDITLNKAGVVPFYRDAEGKIQILWMKPKPKFSDNDSLPQWQVCKGTRKFRREKEWKDIRPDKGEIPRGEEPVETFVETALREGAEEIGLKSENIKQLYPYGKVEYESQRFKDKMNAMWVALVEVKSPNDFMALQDIHDPVAEREWITWDERNDEITPGHYKVVKKLMNALQKSLSQKIKE